MTHYRDYVWKNRIPCGTGVVDPAQEASYKIVMDPYRKRVSIEHYEMGKFAGIAYDSAIFDFRKLEPIQQMAWQREAISEQPTETICLIRDQDDRIILIETQLFEKDLCRECRLVSPQGIEVSTHRIFYRSLHDPFDGVILFDANAHPVMLKRYQVGEEGNFTDLIEERWDFSNVALPVLLKEYSAG